MTLLVGLRYLPGFGESPFKAFGCSSSIRVSDMNGRAELAAQGFGRCA